MLVPNNRRFGLTRERIRQLEAKALTKLRHPSRSAALRTETETPVLLTSRPVTASEASSRGESRARCRRRRPAADERLELIHAAREVVKLRVKLGILDPKVPDGVALIRRF